MEQGVREAMGVDRQPNRLNPVNRPIYENAAKNHIPLEVTSGIYTGLSGIVQEIRVSNESYVYGLSDLPHPANPNKVYWFTEMQLTEATSRVPTNVPLTRAPTAPTPDYYLPSRLDTYIEGMSLVKSVQMELRILREEMQELKALVSRQMGQVRVHVTYSGDTKDEIEETYEPIELNTAAAQSSDNGGTVSDDTRPRSQTRTKRTGKPGTPATGRTKPGGRREVPDRNRTPETLGLPDESGNDSIPEPDRPTTTG